MWQRATRIRSFGSLVIRDASLEDIFIMKLIANRPETLRTASIWSLRAWT